MAKQMTLKAPFTLEGKGLHTGLNVVLTAKPAAENTGIIVRRVDLEVDNEIPALAENVAATERGTVLVKGEAKVSTIEHCMAALYAAGIDNCVENPLSYNEGELTVGSSAVMSEMTGTDYVKLIIKIVKIPVTDKPVSVSCNAFAIVDNKLKYVSDGTVNETAEPKTV